MERETTKQGPRLDDALEAETRSLVQFPAGRDALLTEARGASAPEPVLAALEALPAGVTYGTVHEVWAALEGHEDVRAAAAREPLTEADR